MRQSEMFSTTTYEIAFSRSVTPVHSFPGPQSGAAISRVHRLQCINSTLIGLRRQSPCGAHQAVCALEA